MDPKTMVAELLAGGMSQTQIADFCKCSQATISDINSGDIKVPRWTIVDGLRLLHAAQRSRQSVAPVEAEG